MKLTSLPAVATPLRSAPSFRQRQKSTVPAETRGAPYLARRWADDPEDYMNPDDLIGVLGPLTSDWGMKAWRLLLGHTEIVGWPYRSREAWRLGFSIETGLVRDPGMLLQTGDRDEFQKALLGRDVRRYQIRDLASITLLKQMSRNKLKIDRVNGTSDRYSILYRGQTESYRELLRRVYAHHLP